MNDPELDKVLEFFPLTEERRTKLLELTKSIDFRVIILNELLVSLNLEQATPENALAKYAEARKLAQLLNLKSISINKK